MAEISQFGRLLIRLRLAIVFIGGRLLSNQFATSGRIGALLKQMIGRFEIGLKLRKLIVRIELVVFLFDRIVIGLVFGVRQIQFTITVWLGKKVEVRY